VVLSASCYGLLIFRLVNRLYPFPTREWSPYYNPHLLALYTRCSHTSLEFTAGDGVKYAILLNEALSAPNAASSHAILFQRKADHIAISDRDFVDYGRAFPKGLTPLELLLAISVEPLPVAKPPAVIPLAISPSPRITATSGPSVRLASGAMGEFGSDPERSGWEIPHTSRGDQEAQHGGRIPETENAPSTRGDQQRSIPVDIDLSSVSYLFTEVRPDQI
jgi:hypothetical protein